MSNDKQDVQMNMVLENVAEIGMMIGVLLSQGFFPKIDLDLSSTDVSQAIIGWAKEFEQKYSGPEFNFDEVHELGYPIGYLEAIDNFTDLKMREAGWLTPEYIVAKGRFWNAESATKS